MPEAWSPHLAPSLAGLQGRGSITLGYHWGLLTTHRPIHAPCVCPAVPGAGRDKCPAPGTPDPAPPKYTSPSLFLGDPGAAMGSEGGRAPSQAWPGTGAALVWSAVGQGHTPP